jgi:hypothetical protein
MPRKDIEPAPPRVQPSLPAVPPIALGIKDAALAIGATPFFVGCLIRTGKLPKIKLGKRYVIEVQALRDFIASQREAA